MQLGTVFVASVKRASLNEEVCSSDTSVTLLANIHDVVCWLTFMTLFDIVDIHDLVCLISALACFLGGREPCAKI